MEINKQEGLTPLQQFRYELLQWCGKTEDAAEAYRFVMGTEQQEAKAEAQLSDGRLGDGVYLMTEGHAPVKFNGGETDWPEGLRIGAVGLVTGDFGIRIALQDEAGGLAIGLTTKANGRNPEKDMPFYVEPYLGAVEKTDGAIGTRHLEPVLNPQIELRRGWHIPSLGEMYRIFINLKKINIALVYADGEPLQLRSYWTSTEGGAASAWMISLQDGTMINWPSGPHNSGVVRLVSAFQ